MATAICWQILRRMKLDSVGRGRPRLICAHRTSINNREACRPTVSRTVSDAKRVHAATAHTTRRSGSKRTYLSGAGAPEPEP